MFAKILSGLEFCPEKDELVYIYGAGDLAIEEEHIKFVSLLGNTLVIEIKDCPEHKTVTTRFLSILFITEVDIELSFAEILKKRSALKNSEQNVIPNKKYSLSFTTFHEKCLYCGFEGNIEVLSRCCLKCDVCNERIQEIFALQKEQDFLSLYEA